jgi:mycothiol synthase
MLEITTEILPTNFLVRVPKMDDLQEVFELSIACDMADSGIVDFTLEEYRMSWLDPDFNLATDAWVITGLDGKIVGYAETGQRQHAKIFGWVRVLPDYRGQGLEQYLIHLTEARARQHITQAAPQVRVTISNGSSHNNQAFAGILGQEGYTYRRSFCRMEIDMEEVPPAPEWPEGISIRTMQPGEERAVYELDEEAFQDHWGHMPTTFEDWEYWNVKRSTFDPSLWFLAVEDDTLAGGAFCSYDKELGLGWIGTLAVRRPWRRKGLGMALLHQAFGEFYRRDIRKAGLGVDSQNLTGATRLYERAGMHVALQFDSYEKELRPGVELSIQSLSDQG